MPSSQPGTLSRNARCWQAQHVSENTIGSPRARVKDVPGLPDISGSFAKKFRCDSAEMLSEVREARISRSGGPRVATRSAVQRPGVPESSIAGRRHQRRGSPKVLGSSVVGSAPGSCAGARIRRSVSAFHAGILYSQPSQASDSADQSGTKGSPSRLAGVGNGAPGRGSTLSVNHTPSASACPLMVTSAARVSKLGDHCGSGAISVRARRTPSISNRSGI